MKFALKEPMTIICRVEGPKGIVRELSAIIDFNSTYCLIFAKDAIDIGYPAAANRPREWRAVYPDQAPYLFGMRGIESAILVKLKRVALGNISHKEVEAVALAMEPARMLPFDFILGRSFLKYFKVSIDGRTGFLSIS
jgi:hypothetical protein